MRFLNHYFHLSHNGIFMKHSILAFAALLLSGCGGSSSNTSSDSFSTTQPVSIAFSATANDQDIACDTVFTDLGTANTSATLQDFRFFVHDIVLIADDDTEIPVTLDVNNWQYSGVALLDFQDRDSQCAGSSKETHTRITGTIPNNAVTLSGVRFTIGVPEALNHQSTSGFESPLNIFSLSWGWQAGYKFMRIDMAPVGGGTKTVDSSAFTVWNFHLGSTACVGDPESGDTVVCDNINRPEIVLENFDPEQNGILVDYSALIQQNHLAQDEGGASGCMSGITDPECNEVFSALGLNLSNGENDTAFVQRVFRVIP